MPGEHAQQGPGRPQRSEDGRPRFADNHRGATLHGTQQYQQTPEGDLQRRTDGTVFLELAYDELGNLTQAKYGNGTTNHTIDYVIDGFGRRIARKLNGSFDRAWLYRDALRPIAEIDSAGTFTHFVYANDATGGAPDFILRSGVPYRIVKDHLGSVRLVVHATNGAVAQRLDYDEFGRVLSDTAPGFQPFGFAGGLYDWETKLVRFGARDYDPGMGRWTSKDPIGFAGGDTNVYVYAFNDPVNLVDFTGLQAAPCGTPGNPSCGDSAKRYARLSLLERSIDALALLWQLTPDPEDPREHKRTVAQATLESGLEYTAGIVVGANGLPRLTRTFVGTLNETQVKWEGELQKGDRIVGTVHSHPGGALAEHFDQRDLTTARNHLRDNYRYIHPMVGAKFYVLQPAEVGNGVLVFEPTRGRRGTITQVRFY